MSLPTALRRLDAAWRAPFQADPLPKRARWRAWLDMMLFDHGLLRVGFKNFHTVAPGIWRSNQPAPGDIARLARRGLRTIVNFRDASSWGSYALEREAAARHGIALIDLRLFSRAPPHAAAILRLDEILRTAPRPLLMHCKSGADRAGIGAALALILAEGADIATARRQLSWRYLHVSAGKTGVLDHVLDCYEADTGGAKPFLDWVREDYDHIAIRARYRPAGAATLLTDWVLRRE